MAETIIAIVLATGSAKGGNVVFRWPPSPKSSPRLSRPIPDDLSLYDNPWRASHMPAQDEPRQPLWDHDDDYLWHRPNAQSSRAISVAHSASGRTSPTKEASGTFECENRADRCTGQDEYDHLLGYSSEYLAGLLCPKRSLCHQKFVLKVDDLCFLGHPVCAESGGFWKFKSERSTSDPRGRDIRKRRVSDESGPTSNVTSQAASPVSSQLALPTWLQAFHVVLVHDLPDPSSSISGNLQKYFDIIYEQVAFTLTAVLFQEQVLSNFIEAECDILGAIKDDFAARGEPFEAYMQEALTATSIAPAIKTLYESIKSRSLAHITIHNIPLELQLPPYLDSLIKGDDDYEFADPVNPSDEFSGNSNPWGREMSFAWRLPSLAPWKSLLLLEGSEGRDSWSDVYDNIRGSHVKDEDKLLAEQLIKFLEMADVTLSLADMASLLDWDLETQVFPIVRWLVHHRRAKIVDIVHRGLKTVFTLPLEFDKPLRQLTIDFRDTFTDPSIPALPELMAKISKTSSEHFYSSVVQTKDKIPLYLDIVQWMLQHDLLVTLHLRIRVVATTELKRRVRRYWGSKPRRRDSWKDVPDDAFAQRGRRHTPVRDSDERFDGSPRWPSSRRGSSSQPSRSAVDAIEPPILEEGLDFDEELDEKIAEAVRRGDTPDRGSRDNEEEDSQSSIIPDPARADIVQRQWLQMMSEGKEDAIVRRFDQINRYFDGKCTDDEILFRAEISRKQLREVLHHYDEYLQTFLHPS